MNSSKTIRTKNKNNSFILSFDFFAKNILPGIIWAWLIQPLSGIISLSIYQWHPYTAHIINYSFLLPLELTGLVGKIYPVLSNNVVIALIVVPLIFAEILWNIVIRPLLPKLFRLNKSSFLYLCIGVLIMLTIIISLTLRSDANYKKSTYQKVVNELNSVHFTDTVVAYWIQDAGCNFVGDGCIITGYKTFVHTGKWQDDIESIITTLKNSGWKVDYYEEQKPYGPYETNLQAYVNNGNLSLMYDVNGITGSAFGLDGQTATTNGAFGLDASNTNNSSDDIPTGQIYLNKLNSLKQNEFTYTIWVQANY